MTSEAREASLDQGEPVKFFRFTRGTVNWYYVNGDRDRVLDGITYTAAPISHSEITDGGGSGKIAITITMAKDLPVAGNWRPYPPSDAIAVTIWTQHVGETDALVDWIGRVTSPEFSSTELKLASEPSSTTAKRGGKGRALQKGCDHVLGSQGDGQCNVDLAGYATPATLSAVAGLALTGAGFLLLPSGRLRGGFIEWTRVDGLPDRRTILAHSGDTITVDFGAADLAIGLDVTAYPGCAGTWDDCAYYGNNDNYGGFLYRPNKNHYDGMPV